MNNPTLRSTLITITSFILVITAVSAWDGPELAPPDGNASAPITVSTDNQEKFGGLWLASLAVTGKAISSSTVDSDPGNTLVTKDYVDGIVGGGGLGYGQTWQDMLGSSVGCESTRASGVLCTNSTPKPIMVNVTTHSSNVTVYCYIGTGTNLMVGGAQRYQNGWGDSMGSLSFIVPPGETYHCDTPSAWVQAWAELR